MYESTTEMFPQCSPTCARNALLVTDNNLEAAINLTISNQAQSTTTTQEIYASFEFCSEIENDPEFTENNNPREDETNMETEISSISDKKQLRVLLTQQRNVTINLGLTLP